MKIISDEDLAYLKGCGFEDRLDEDERLSRNHPTDWQDLIYEAGSNLWHAECWPSKPETVWWQSPAFATAKQAYLYAQLMEWGAHGQREDGPR